ncbi:MAG: DUF4249 family protein [Calditrichaceae bacterium]|jgi:hypothetical protein
MKVIIFFTMAVTMILVYACGEGTVEVENKSYEPKIVIDGYIMPHQKVEKIKIARNFRIDADLTQTSLIPEVSSTTVTITDLQTNLEYPLTFHTAPDQKFDNYYWEYNGGDLIIEYAHSYRLDVAAVIEGKQLHASAVTTVPQQGFRIEQINHRELKFRQTDNDGEIVEFELTISRSPGTTFYVTTIVAENASIYNFIYDSPYSTADSSDVQDDLIDWSYTYDWTQDTPQTPGQTRIEMFWPYFMFYSDYTITTMACDVNYKEFLQTYNDVQEEDGNFHEAKFNIEGDGIGVFGSVVMDTVTVRVTP